MKYIQHFSELESLPSAKFIFFARERISRSELSRRHEDVLGNSRQAFEGKYSLSLRARFANDPSSRSNAGLRKIFQGRYNGQYMSDKSEQNDWYLRVLKKDRTAFDGFCRFVGKTFEKSQKRSVSKGLSSLRKSAERSQGGTPAQVVGIRSSLNVRSRAGGSVIGSLRNNQSVTYLGQTSGGYRKILMSNGKVGWASARYIQVGSSKRNISKQRLSKVVSKESKKQYERAEKVGGRRGKVIQKALELVRNGVRANHCTAWVEKVYRMAGAHQGGHKFRGKIVKQGNKLRATKFGSSADKAALRPGDHIIIANGNQHTGLHSCLVLENNGGGNLKVASFGGGSRPPRVHNCNLNRTKLARSWSVA